MPTYVALLYRTEADQPAPGSPAQQELRKAWGAYRREIAKAGVMKSGTGVMPTSMATTIRVRDGKTLTTDGPFAETKEQLAGFEILECKDLDEAIYWASKIPDSATGSVEVRPAWNG